MCLSVTVALLISQSTRHLGFANRTGFRIGTVLLVVGLAFYFVEKERHLRRLAKLLTDERVLGAALSNRLKELAVLVRRRQGNEFGACGERRTQADPLQRVRATRGLERIHHAPTRSPVL